MRYSKIIKDERGTVRIEVKLWVSDSFGVDRDGNIFRYDVMVFHTPPSKRKEVAKNLSSKDSIATDEEIQIAKIEAWKTIKPK